MGKRWCILLGLLFLCRLALSQECVGGLLENMDFPGTDITFVYSPDVEHCQMMCTQHFSCQFFTFVRPDWTIDGRHFYCYLKSTSSGQPRVLKPLFGVTSGFSQKACSPEPRPDLAQVYEDVDFFGADYRFLFTGDYEECQRACTYDPSCQFFTFVTANFTSDRIRYKCHLKFSWTIPMTPIVETLSDVVSGFSHKRVTHSTFGSKCQHKFFPGTDIPGNDLLMLPAASPDHCLSLCSDHPGCTYFSYDSNELKCQLKKNPNEMAMAAKDGVTSGLPSRFCQQDYSWTTTAFEGIDFRGSDMRYILLDDPQTCQQSCTADPYCQFYTYVSENFSKPSYRRRCFLKRSITLPAPPEVVKRANLVSGFTLKSRV